MLVQLLLSSEILWEYFGSCENNEILGREYYFTCYIWGLKCYTEVIHSAMYFGTFRANGAGCLVCVAWFSLVLKYKCH